MAKASGDTSSTAQQETMGKLKYHYLIQQSETDGLVRIIAYPSSRDVDLDVKDGGGTTGFVAIKTPEIMSALFNIAAFEMERSEGAENIIKAPEQYGNQT